MGYTGDRTHLQEGAGLGVGVGVHHPTRWHCFTRLEKRWTQDTPEGKAGELYEVLENEGNVLVNGGASVIWRRLIVRNPSTSSTGAALQAYSTGNARIAVSNSTAAATASQTTMPGTVVYRPMDTAFPSHTDGTTTAARTVTFRSVFPSSVANFAWGSWGVFNTTGANRRMLNRRAQALGTKTTAAAWTFTISFTLS